MTGDTVLSRCLKARKSLEQSLGQVQSIVPVMLAAEVCQITFLIRFPLSTMLTNKQMTLCFFLMVLSKVDIQTFFRIRFTVVIKLS